MNQLHWLCYCLQRIFPAQDVSVRFVFLIGERHRCFSSGLQLSGWFDRQKDLERICIDSWERKVSCSVRRHTHNLSLFSSPPFYPLLSFFFFSPPPLWKNTHQSTSFQERDHNPAGRKKRREGWGEKKQARRQTKHAAGIRKENIGGAGRTILLSGTTPTYRTKPAKKTSTGTIFNVHKESFFILQDFILSYFHQVLSCW